MSGKKRSLRCAAVQFESRQADKDVNLKRMEHFIASASAQGVRLIVFPECCITGYWFIRNLTVRELAAIAEPIPDGPSTQRLIALARKHGISIGAGLVENGRRGVFHNSYVVALPDGTFHRHRKLHAFEHDAYFERNGIHCLRFA
jgi:predicted amidohydrolase